MSRAKYNLKKLIKIAVQDKEIEWWYTFKKEQRFLWWCVRKEGYYFGFMSSSKLHKLDKIKKEYIIDDENKVIYNKPKLVFCFQGDYRYYEEYDTIDEAIKARDEFITKNNLDLVELDSI